MNDFSLEDFSGEARLFPIPNMVMFPGVIQPLHIFEPRYRDMIADALDDDRMLAIAVLQPGYEEHYYEAPPIAPIACLGRITDEEQLSDGRYNFLLHGLTRIRLVEERTTDLLYRTAEVELVESLEIENPDLESKLRSRLARGVMAWFQSHGTIKDQVEELLKSALPLSSLCDIFSFALPLELQIKEQLLDAVEVQSRTELLLKHLPESSSAPEAKKPGSKFPPDFSSN